METQTKSVAGARNGPDAAELPPFLPLPQLKMMRESAAQVVERRSKRRMDFKLSVGEQGATFRYGIDFVEGNNRLCWTPAGIDRLIGLRLWRREFDQRGALKSKPMTVETAMKLPGTNRALQSGT